jgi:hypothetical protein
MNKNKWIHCAGLVAAVAFSGSISSASDLEEDDLRPLSGEYRVVITSSCVRTPYQPVGTAGFDANTKQLLVEGEMLTALGSGLMRFSLDGTVQILEGVQTEVSLDQYAAGKIPVAPPVEFTCGGTYTRQGRKLLLNLPCDIKVPNFGVTVTLGPQEFEGYLSRNRQSVNVTNIAGGIQTITVSVGGTPTQQRQRICTQQVSGSK